MTRPVPLGMTPAERKQHLAPQSRRSSGGCLLPLLVVLAVLLLLWLT